MRQGRKIGGHGISVWLLWALGAAVLLSAPMALADPSIWVLVLDPELLALLIAVAISAARIGIPMYVHSVLARLPGRKAGVDQRSIVRSG